MNTAVIIPMTDENRALSQAGRCSEIGVGCGDEPDCPSVDLSFRSIRVAFHDDSMNLSGSSASPNPYHYNIK